VDSHTVFVVCVCARNMYMHVHFNIIVCSYMFVCARVYACVCVYVIIYIHIYIYIFMCIYICIYIYMCIHMLLCTYIYIYTNMHICIYTCIYVYIYKYVYIHIYMHIYMCAYWYTCASFWQVQQLRNCHGTCEKLAELATHYFLENDLFTSVHKLLQKAHGLCLFSWLALVSAVHM